MQNLSTIQQRIHHAAKRAGKDPAAIRLIAVSKGQPLEKIEAAWQAGQKDFGENYAQELLQKSEVLAGRGIRWHFIGHLQSNKVAKVLPVIAWLHTLDSLELAQAIQKRAQRPLPCLLEIKLGKEPAKTGLSPEAALALVPKLNNLDKIDLQGLMTIPPLSEDADVSRPYFRELFSLLKTINERYLYPRPLTELSMGMSHDFEVAIEEGATMVRIGEALFGPRLK